jgi:hypothetical protein
MGIDHYLFVADCGGFANIRNLSGKGSTPNAERVMPSEINKKLNHSMAMAIFENLMSVKR